MADNTEELTVESWWTVERGSARRGATPLVERCMRLLGWNFDFTCRVLNGYHDFVKFKHAFGDWDAKKLSPSRPVDNMWHMHILDTRCYENDCKLLVGQIVHHDADGDLNAEARKKRIDNTKSALKIQYPDGYDEEVWSFGERLGQREKAEQERNMVSQRKANRASRELDSPINRVALITIRLRSVMGEETILTIKRTTRMEKLSDVYAECKGAESASSFRFFLYGKQVGSRETPNSLQLEDYDEMYAMPVMTGC